MSLISNSNRLIAFLVVMVWAFGAYASDELGITSSDIQSFARQSAAQEQALSSGAQLIQLDGSRCTSGFPIRENLTGITAITTAGHCDSQDHSFSPVTDADSNYLGHVLAKRWGFSSAAFYNVDWPSDTDVALILNTGERSSNKNALNPVPYLYVGDANSEVRQYLHDYRDPELGENICFGGAMTGENCRAVVTAVDVSMVVYNNSGVGMVMDGLVEAKSWDGSVLAQPGDSGGPIYTRESKGFNQVITGLGAIEGGGERLPSSTAYFLPVSKLVPTGWSLVRADCSWSWFFYTCSSAP